MKDIYLWKTKKGLIPSDELGAEVLESYNNGDLLRCKITKPRNLKFHRKFMKLLRVGFEYWEPGEISCKYGTPQKNFERFREDVTILAGFYDVHTRLDGTTRVVAKSVSFSAMTEEQFQELYSAVIQVLLNSIFVNYTEMDVIKMAEQEVLSFA